MLCLISQYTASGRVRRQRQSGTVDREESKADNKRGQKQEEVSERGEQSQREDWCVCHSLEISVSLVLIPITHAA